jgi:uncharacterized protein (TIGR00299 family) protein
MIGGASGNMLLGALIDAGANVDAILSDLRTIPVAGWTFVRERVVKNGVAAEYVDFVIPGEDGHPGEAAHGRHLHDVLAIISGSGLPPRVRDRALAVYRRLGEAEARVHGEPIEHIHFHEMGQIDAILDVAAVCLALDDLRIERLTCSDFPFGHGEIVIQHGRYPNPPPSTLELLRGAPLRAVDIAGEMVTPTGAAILMTLCDDVGVRPMMTAETIGYGAGKSTFALPNVTRVMIGEIASVLHDEVIVLEANIDDLSPQAYELAIERIFAAGALDVWTVPIAMKKQRPAITLAAIAPPERADACAQAMLRETSTLGVRMRREARVTVPREIVTVATPYGDVRVKRAQIGAARRSTLEYDDIVRIARERDVPLADLARELQAYADA